MGHSRSGFVLLEAVVALAIIGLVAIALLETTGSQIRSASKANVMLTARTLAEDRLAALRLLDYEDLSKLPDSLESGIFAAPYDDYTWSVTVKEWKDEEDLFETQVVVAGMGESFPLTTLIHVPKEIIQMNVGGQNGADGTSRSGFRGLPRGRR